MDSNPDGQDLERIAQITGLSKRVTQVWFQNSRARQKKHLHTSKIKPSGKYKYDIQYICIGTYKKKSVFSIFLLMNTKIKICRDSYTLYSVCIGRKD